jgi:general secretion pathway protein A
MYAEFYGLRELPFNVTPDPRFLYLNDCYQEALAALAYGIDARKGFISLIGEAGTGKTTLLRRLLDSLGPNTRSVLLLNPTVSFDEILEHILLELGVPAEGGKKLVLLERLNEFLIEHTGAGGNVALLIDEAQDLAPGVLEELRLLSNLETAREKILQIVLAGQPELDATLADTALRQLRQRVTLRIRIRPLASAEVASYVRSRLDRAGTPTPDLFSGAALGRVAALSGGIPRVVNVLCDAALLVGFATGRRQVTPEVVEDAWRDYSVDGVGNPPADPTRSIPPSAVPPPPPDETADPPAPAAPPAAVTAPTGPAAAEPEPSPGANAAAPTPPARLRERPPVARVRTPAAPRSALGIPVAAAVVALLAVTLSIVSVRQEWPDAEPASPAVRATPTQGLGAVLEATAAEPPAAPAPAADAAPAETTPTAAPAIEGAPSAAEAAVLIDEFRTAYEARDIDRILELFAPDASENGVQGIEAIASSYRARLPELSEVRYTMPRFSVAAQGTRTDVRAPIVISFRKSSGASGEIRGEAEWKLERRAGRTRIVALDYRVDPES